MGARGNGVIIERMVVEGGFLDGLDLRFSAGLNVLIGERGAGKTSVIELLRFALGTPALTERFARVAREHTASVLGEGRVSVSFRVDGEQRTSSRRIGDPAPEGGLSSARSTPIVLSQNEIEAVGLDTSGRLRLIDGFLAVRQDARPLMDRQASALAAVASLSAELQSLDNDIEEMVDRVGDQVALLDELKTAEQELSRSQLTAARVSSQVPELSRLADETARRSVRTAALERVLDGLRHWRGGLDEVARSVPDLSADLQLAVDVQPDLTNVLADAVRSVEATSSRLATVEDTLDRELDHERRTQADLHNRARELRLELERVQAGAGSAVRRVSELKEEAAQLEALAQRLDQTRKKREVRAGERDRVLNALDESRSRLFDQRKAAADEVSTALGPRIRVVIEHAGMRADYAKAIADLLKGSGLRYAQLAPTLAAALTPRLLVAAIEAEDLERLRRSAELSADRAKRLMYALRATNLGEVLTANLEDLVVLMLLDGDEYKPTPMLSTGQRCTVVLPILLCQDERPLIIDQPEDHLDNAYVVDTLVRAIAAREAGSQLIVSTHNPNVPVLGAASQVTLLGSDGRRGFARFSGPLDDVKVVDAITTIMEGGAEAFRRRARFYDRVSHDSW